jgi:asparagine synthase (glutamine-hydrolysing)
MCGIAGIFHHRTRRPADPGLVRRMLALLPGRGPDGTSVWSDGEIAVGTARLAILGGEEGAQPTWSTAGDHLLVVNGEVFNFRELQGRLGLTSRSDARVLAEHLAREGPAGLAAAEGMFAGALFSLRDRRLTLFRDRLGEKPLFVGETADGLAFASALRPLLLLPGVARDLDMEGIAAFLSHGYMPGHLGPLRGIRAFPPASWRHFGAGEGEGTYWSPAEGAVASDPPDAQADFRRLFARAVRRRLESDVPLTIFLSGGIDSTAVLAESLRQGRQAPTQAFTLALEGEAGEAGPAGETCRALGIAHVRVPLGADDIPRRLERVVLAADNLLANPPMFALDLLAETVSPRYKVALSGGGGDELFYGYPTWRADRIFPLYRRLPAALRRQMARAAAILPPAYGPHAPTYVLRKFLSCPDDDPRRVHAWWRTILVGDEARLLGGHLDADWFRAGYGPAYEAARLIFPGDFLRQTALADLSLWWRDMGLYGMDALGMRHGVEVRSPFMDHHLVAWALAQPPGLLYHPWRPKLFLRRALAPGIPPHILRGRKRPFHLPLGSWFAGPLAPFLRENLLDRAYCRGGLLRREGIETLLDDHLRRREDNSFKLLCLLVLAVWYDLVYQGVPAPPAATGSDGAVP